MLLRKMESDKSRDQFAAGPDSAPASTWVWFQGIHAEGSSTTAAMWRCQATS